MCMCEYEYSICTLLRGCTFREGHPVSLISALRFLIDSSTYMTMAFSIPYLFLMHSYIISVFLNYCTAIIYHASEGEEYQKPVSFKYIDTIP